MTDHPPAPRRRWRLIILAGLLALFQAGAAWQAVTTPAELAARVSLPPGLQFVAGGLWALLFGFITVTLIQNRLRTIQPVLWTLAAFVGYSVLRLALFAQADYDRARLPFLWGILLLVSAIAAASWLRRQSHGEA
jgi:cytochrome bd-type quinol oxidase subunit 2